jgi:hypothetical protein
MQLDQVAGELAGVPSVLAPLCIHVMQQRREIKWRRAGILNPLSSCATMTQSTPLGIAAVSFVSAFEHAFARYDCYTGHQMETYAGRWEQRR